MIGKVFGDMKIIKYLGKEKCGIVFEAECKICGRIKKISKYKLENGISVQHSGCGFGLKTKDERFNDIWVDMRQRTTNVKAPDFKRYGGRGISSDSWKYFIDFYDDMYESYLEHVSQYGEKETTLERINNNDDYRKDNCRWATLSEQQSNTRRNKWFKAISPNGEIHFAKNQHEFAREHNLNKSCINSCLNKIRNQKTHKGWKFEFLEDEPT